MDDRAARKVGIAGGVAGGSASGNAGAASEDRFDALLEERFSADQRRDMARQLAEHDRRQAPGGFDREHVRRRIRFRGDCPKPFQDVLRNAIPALLEHAAGQGIRLRDLNHQVLILDKAAYEQDRGAPVPHGVSLPAASCQANQLYRVYTVRVVLSGRPPNTEEATAVLRVVMSRMLGDIYWREEVLSGEAYREEVALQDGQVTAGMAEKILVLDGLTDTPPAFAAVLKDQARAIGMDYRRFPDKVRKVWFQNAAADLERQALDDERAEWIDTLFGDFMAGLRADPSGAAESAMAAVETLNRQMTILPPDEAPDYAVLREKNPPHFLRSAQLRLEFLIEVLGSLIDAFAELEPGESAASPLVEEHVEGQMMELRRQGLVRPYLVPNVKLSDDLERKLAGFPFEVQALLDRMPPADNREKAFRALQKRITNSLYQRLYAVLLNVKVWMRNRELGRDAAFRGGERYKAIKGQIANFQFRLPFLQALNARVGIVLDSLEAGTAAEQSARKARLPAEELGRAWSYFIAARVVAQGIPAELLPRFDGARFRAAVDEALTKALGQGKGFYPLAYLLERICDLSGGEGLRVVDELVKAPSGTFRFVLQQALQWKPAPGAPGQGPSDQSAALDQPAQLEQWARLVLQARDKSRANAIVPGAG